MTTTSRLDTPVLRLIGWLLLLLGLAGVEQATMALWQAAAYRSNPGVQMMLGVSASPTEFFLQYGISMLYNLALLVVGIALLRRVRWARWAAVVTLLFIIAWSSLYPLVRAFVFWYPIYAAHLPELRQGLWGMLLGLLGALPHLVMILFLVPPRAEDAVGRGNVLQRAACAVQGHVARLMPSVVAFVALYLLALGLKQLSGVPVALTEIQHPITDGNVGGVWRILSGLNLLLPLVNMVAGLVLLARVRHAVEIAVGALGLGVISVLTQLVLIVSFIYHPPFEVATPMLSQYLIITMLLFAPAVLIAGMLLQAAYLLRARREVPADG